MVASLVLTARIGPAPRRLARRLDRPGAARRPGGGGRRALAAFPERLVELAAAVLFAVGAVVLLREGDTIEDEEDGAGPAVAHHPGRGGARPRSGSCSWPSAATSPSWPRPAWPPVPADPLSVFLGSSLALMAVAGIAVLSGQALLRVLPVALLRRIAAAVFATLALVSLVAAIRG